MNGQLMVAIIAITLALIFYTTGVFGERKAKILHKKHVIIFWIGLICDTIGTLTMGRIATLNAEVSSPLHGITGFIAIVLMLFHALWATWVLYKNDVSKKESFHKFSIVVWAIWLVPYILGMIIGMK